MKRVQRNIPTTPFKVKPLGVALAIAMGAAVTVPTAQAVNFAEDGVGEVLLFPYYTVRNGFDTSINITNTSATTVAFKIRFREGENSRDARDFNVVLSPYDVWNATVTLSPNGETARLVTGDMSCTAPALPIDAGGGRRAVDFTNLDYTAGNNDWGNQTFDRTKEGYIEVIQMGHATAGAEDNEAQFNGIPYNAKHVNGVPRDCAKVRQAFTPGGQGGTLATTQDLFFEPINVLKGTATLMQVDSGKGASYEPVVLANFFNPNIDDGMGAAGVNLIDEPASTSPNLADALPKFAALHGDNSTFSVWGNFADNDADAVSALFMRTSVMNQFSVNPGVNGMTDWVVTFPTKNFYVDEREGAVSGPMGLAPFDDAETFQENQDGLSCVPVNFSIWDREEFSPEDPDDLQFSPPPPPGEDDSICYEVNVISFNGGGLLGSALAKDFNAPANNGINAGWMRLNFTAPGEIMSTSPLVSLTGLPVVGMAITTLENGVSGDNLMNYGLAFEHAYSRVISAEPGND